MKVWLRRLILAAGLLMAFFPGLANAANCSGSGALSIKVAPCPYNRTIESGVLTSVNITTTIGGHVSGQVYIAVHDPAHIIANGTFGVSAGPVAGSYLAHFDIVPSLAVGYHNGSLTVYLCPVSSCANVYTSATLPYSLHVVVPPQISSLSPPYSLLHGAAFTLKVLGAHFDTGSRILFNNRAQTTKFISSSELEATISFTATKGQYYSVTVQNSAGMVSAAKTLTLRNPPPKLTQLLPVSAPQSAPFKLTVKGSGFTSSSYIRFGSSALTTTYVSSTQLAASLNLSRVAPGTATAVAVVTPAPGGGASSSLKFTTDNLLPAISSLSSTSVTTGSQAIGLWIYGSQFQPNSLVQLTGAIDATLTPTFISAAELEISIPASDLASGGVTVSVVNPTPGGGASNGATLNVDYVQVPVLSGISPSSAVLGSDSFTLTVTGSAFQPNSVVQVTPPNGVVHALTTSYISSTELQAQVPAGVTYAVQDLTITVTTQPPGGGTSAGQTLSVVNAAPMVTNISPATVLAGGNGFTLAVNGTGFQSNSTIQLAGASLTTTFKSSTQLTAKIGASSVASAGDSAVTVTTPTPGGGVSDAAVLSVTNGVPAIGWVTPLRGYVGGGDTVLTVGGSNFSNATAVAWNGSALQTTFVSNTVIQAVVPAADLAAATSATLSVANPTPGGGEADTSYTVAVAAPAITSLSPGYAITGATDFTLTVNGTGFDPAAVVDWNGAALTTTSYVSATELEATVPAADVANDGVATVSVANPAGAGGASVPATFAVDPSGTAVLSLTQVSNDIEWDGVNFTLLASVPASDANYPDGVLAIDPVAAAVTGSATVAAEPRLLAVSHDGEFLYASLDSTRELQRFTLPGLNPDISFQGEDPADSSKVLAMQVSPTYPHLLATADQISRGANLFMDGNLFLTPAQGSGSWNTMAWSPDGTTLYGAGESSTSRSDLDVEDFTLQGVTIAADWTTIWPISSTVNLYYDPDGLIYTSLGKAVDPVAGAIVGDFGQTNLPMVPDSSQGCVYFVSAVIVLPPPPSQDQTLYCYDPGTYTLTRSMVIPGMVGIPTKLLRWGNEGLVIQTTKAIYFISGQFVTGN